MLIQGILNYTFLSVIYDMTEVENLNIIVHSIVNNYTLTDVILVDIM